MEELIKPSWDEPETTMLTNKLLQAIYGKPPFDPLIKAEPIFCDDYGTLLCPVCSNDEDYDSPGQLLHQGAVEVFNRQVECMDEGFYTYTPSYDNYAIWEEEREIATHLEIQDVKDKRRSFPSLKERLAQVRNLLKFKRENEIKALPEAPLMNDERNPSLYRSGINIEFHCEECLGTYHLCIAQHKGNTQIFWKEGLDRGGI